MKSRLPLLLAVFVTAAAAGLLILRKDRTPSSTPAKTETPANPGGTKTEDPTGGGKAADSSVSVIDRVLAAKNPKEFAQLAAELSGRALPDADVERLRQLVRTGTQLQRRFAIGLLASLKDADGRNLEVLRDAATAADEFIRHAALGAFRAYAGANPGAAAEVNAFLLNYARSSADVESRQVAVGALSAEAVESSGLLRDTDEEIRIAAIHLVSKPSLLAELYTGDPSVRVKREIIERIQDRKTLESLKGLCRELDPEIDEALRDK